MRRWALRIFVFLILGAIVNVAVAWGCAVRRAGLPIERNQHGYFLIRGRPWQVVQERLFGIADVWWADLSDYISGSLTAQAIVDAGNARRAERQSTGITMPSGRAVGTLKSPPTWGTFKRGAVLPASVMGGDTAFGLPLLCLWMSATSDLVGNSTAHEQLHGGWLIGGAVESRGTQFMALPYRPIWPGFAINTVFYALVLWLLFAAPFVLRRRRRIRRGLCPKCAYDLRGTPGATACPECGAARTADR